jgi:hypothetical protein
VPAVERGPLNMDEPAVPAESSASDPNTELSAIIEPALDEGESAFNTEPSIVAPVLNEGESDSDYLSDPAPVPVHRRSTTLEKPKGQSTLTK